MKSKGLSNTLLWLLGLVAMLSSCNGAEEIVAYDTHNVTFSLSADGEEATRSSAAVTRYVMAIYDETGENKVVSEKEFDSNTFSVRLNAGKYTCLFWADHGSANYDAANLTAISAKANTADDANAEAFYAKHGITVTNGDVVNITLRRAVAQVILRETAKLYAGTLTVNYTAYQNFNVGTGVASNEASFTNTFSVASNITGSVSSPAEVCSLFLLANSDENQLGDFKVKYEDDDEISISNVPIQANCKTNLNGKFGGEIPYVTFSAESEQTFKMDFNYSGRGVFTLGAGEYFEYSVGNGSWTSFSSTVDGIAFGGTLGNLRLRGKSSKGTADSFELYSRISFDESGVKVDCKGDIRTLIDYEKYRTVSTTIARFCCLFRENTLLRTAPNLPATTLETDCYYSMFYGCTSLTTAPELPAITLAEACYDSMFYGCTSLTTAPELPAITLAEACYVSMFYGCTSLTTAPELPATTLEPGCYHYMFQNCTSLTTAPKLRATILKKHCYSNMFQDCTSLTTAPELSAITLAEYCYDSMFYGCTKLSEVKMLATDVTAFRCLRGWLDRAGTEASSRTLTVANQDIYNYKIIYSLPDHWKQGATGTTVNFLK